MILGLLGLLSSCKDKLDSAQYPSDCIPISRSFMGMGGSGRYVHSTQSGRATYNPAYYTIDGRLLEPHY